MRIMRGALAVLIALAVTAGPSAADERDHRRGGEHRRHQGWHGEIHRFHDHDLGRWNAGRWHHGIHGGRSGWWWIVGGVWYYYPAPVYPYHDPYRPPMVPVLAAPPGRNTGTTATIRPATIRMFLTASATGNGCRPVPRLACRASSCSQWVPL